MNYSPDYKVINVPEDYTLEDINGYCYQMLYWVVPASVDNAWHRKFSKDLQESYDATVDHHIILSDDPFPEIGT